MQPRPELQESITYMGDWSTPETHPFVFTVSQTPNTLLLALPRLCTVDDLPKNFPHSQEEWNKLIAAAPEQVDAVDCPYDPNNPVAVDTYWKNGVIVHTGGIPAVHTALANRQANRQIAPVKISLTVQYSTEVVEYFRSMGPGWQSRMDEALKEWIHTHPIAQTTN